MSVTRKGHCCVCGRRYALLRSEGWTRVRAHAVQQPERRIGGPRYCSGSNFSPASSMEIARHIYFVRNWDSTGGE